MDIAGLGTHVVECARVGRLLARHADAFTTLVFTPAEQAFCRGRTHTTEHYAAIWAAKTAVHRSLGTAWRKGQPWTAVEIVFAGRPAATLTGPLADSAAALGVTRVLVAVAHCRTFATGTAIALRS